MRGRFGEATAAEVMADLPGQPTYSSVRSILSILVEKGHVVHREDSNLSEEEIARLQECIRKARQGKEEDDR